MKKAIIISEDFNTVESPAEFVRLAKTLEILEKLARGYEIMAANSSFEPEPLFKKVAPFVHHIVIDSDCSNRIAIIQRDFDVVLAIDSNGKHRAIYSKHSIPAFTLEDFLKKKDCFLSMLEPKLDKPGHICETLSGVVFDIENPIRRPAEPFAPRVRFEKTKVEDILKNSADDFHSRRTEYGDEYLKNGKIRKAFFPNGLTLKTEDDFYYFHLFDILCMKLGRIAGHWKQGQHKDSWHDIIGYSAMALERMKNGK